MSDRLKDQAAGAARARRILAAQLLILAICAVALAELWGNFPYPSPLIRPFLAPKQRWPTNQVAGWVESGNASSAYREFFARDPERHVPPGPNLVSPSDGIVQRIVVRDGTTYLVVGLSFWDVHVVRTPVAGTVTDVEDEGTYLFKSPTRRDLEEQTFLKGKAAPVQQIVTINSRYGLIRVRLITSYWASRLKVWAHPGQRLEKGDRIGRILLGSTVVTELPGSIPLPIKAGERIVGGESIIFNGGSFR